MLGDVFNRALPCQVSGCLIDKLPSAQTAMHISVEQIEDVLFVITALSH